MSYKKKVNTLSMIQKQYGISLNLIECINDNNNYLIELFIVSLRMLVVILYHCELWQDSSSIKMLSNSV